MKDLINRDTIEIFIPLHDGIPFGPLEAFDNRDDCLKFINYNIDGLVENSHKYSSEFWVNPDVEYESYDILYIWASPHYDEHEKVTDYETGAYILDY